MSISIEQVKELREQTGVSIMQCKKALEEAEGDFDKALIILKKKSGAAAAKRAGREAEEGTVVVKSGDSKAVICTLQCETDFVAKNSDFIALAEDLAGNAYSNGIESMKEGSAEAIAVGVQKVGENIKLGDVTEVTGTVIGSYNHNGKSIAVVALSGGAVELARDIAMQIVAMKATYISEDEIPQEDKDKAREHFAEELEKENKPEDMKAKILEGKLASYFKDQVLLSQSFIKDPSKTISQLLKEAGDVTIESYKVQSV
jgi:elongation factor Ts